MSARKATILEMFWISLENQKYPPIHSCKLSKLPGPLTNDPRLFFFFFFRPMQRDMKVGCLQNRLLVLLGRVHIAVKDLEQICTLRPD